MNSLPYVTGPPRHDSRIVHAAVVVLPDDTDGPPRGVVYTGWRHAAIMHEMHKQKLAKHVEMDDQGFVDQYGTFFSREQSEVIALKAGQLKSKYGCVLTSEDLWDNEGIARS